MTRGSCPESPKLIQNTPIEWNPPRSGLLFFYVPFLFRRPKKNIVKRFVVKAPANKMIFDLVPVYQSTFSWLQYDSYHFIFCLWFMWIFILLFRPLLFVFFSLFCFILYFPCILDFSFFAGGTYCYCYRSKETQLKYHSTRDNR